MHQLSPKQAPAPQKAKVPQPAKKGPTTRDLRAKLRQAPGYEAGRALVKPPAAGGGGASGDTGGFLDDAWAWVKGLFGGKGKDKPADRGKQPQKPPQPMRDLADPGLVKKEGKEDPYAYKKAPAGAQLYGPDGVRPGDVQQGAIADCFVPAALAAIASANPQAIRDAITDNGDGTYTVRFYDVGWDGSKKASTVTVDADLPYNGDAPAYAKSKEKVDGKAHMELWPSILEKAYAAWKGSYDEIGHGGNAGAVMTAITGNRSRSQSTSGGGDADPLWTKMKEGTEKKKPMTAGSGDKDDEKYKDPKAGVYGWHAYTVLGVEEKKQGDKSERFVHMRNPWGVRRRSGDASAVGDTENKAEFTLTWAEFRRLFDDVAING